MSAKVDWFSYFLHPEKIDQDFNVVQWSSPYERKAAALQVLGGLVSTSHFREFVIGAYPTLRDAHGQQQPLQYTGPTPPSTPIASPGGPAADGSGVNSLQRVGQCSCLDVSRDTGLPNSEQSLSGILKTNGLPDLSAKQLRLLDIARQLSGLVQFEVEDVEANIHATIRFIYYMHLLQPRENHSISHLEQSQLHFRRWYVRAAYREEEVGLALDVSSEQHPAVDVNCRTLAEYANSLDDMESKDIKYRISYDLGRVHLAQSQFASALEMFQACQRIDPDRGQRNRFGLSTSRSKPSVDEYVDACSTIVESMGIDKDQESAVPEIVASTPTDQFRGLAISLDQHGQQAELSSLMDGGDFLNAVEKCLTTAMDQIATSFKDGSSSDWITCIHPRILHYLGNQPPSDAMASLRNKLIVVANARTDQYIREERLATKDRAAFEEQVSNVISFITCSSLLDSSVQEDILKITTDENTLAEALLYGRETLLSLDVSKTPLALTRLSYCYLSGLRMLEKEEYRIASTWFAHGQAILDNFPEMTSAQNQTMAMPVMAHSIEKDKALRASLAAQIEVYAKLSNILHQIVQAGMDISDMEGEIDDMLELGAPMRFEFLEKLVLLCLRHNNRMVFAKLVSTVATNQKLYQQLPDTHLSLLQIASLLLVVRGVLSDTGIDLERFVYEESVSEKDVQSLLSDEQLEQLQKTVADIAQLLVKIPFGSKSSAVVNLRATVSCVPQAGTKVENEIEKFCRMWDYPVYLVLLGALLAEILQESNGQQVLGPPNSICGLITRIVCQNSLDGSKRKSIVHDAINRSTEAGKKNDQHLQAVALILFKCAARVVPQSACMWLYFSAVAGNGRHLDDLFMPLFVEYLCVHTKSFSPPLLEEAVIQPWFQQRLPEMVQSLVGLKMSGAAAVLYQCYRQISYDKAIPLLAQAFQKGEINQRVAGFFWDSSLIEYGQHKASVTGGNIAVEFAVPSEDLEGSKVLILSNYLLWLSTTLAYK